MAFVRQINKLWPEPVNYQILHGNLERIVPATTSRIAKLSMAPTATHVPSTSSHSSPLASVIRKKNGSFKPEGENILWFFHFNEAVCVVFV